MAVLTSPPEAILFREEAHFTVMAGFTVGGPVGRAMCARAVLREPLLAQWGLKLWPRLRKTVLQPGDGRQAELVPG